MNKLHAAQTIACSLAGPLTELDVTDDRAR